VNITLPTNKMIWSESREEYFFEYDNGRILHVDGDAFLTAVHAAKLADTEAAFDAAREELLDPQLWEGCALEIPKGKQLEEMPNFFQYDAWIEVLDA
jgi:hypothetical protein